MLFFNFLAAPTTPRQTGSLAAPGSMDDVVTRMKNIELIELGKHRIRPWYFSPYPQVKPHFFHAIPYCFYCQYLLFSMSGKKCLPWSLKISRVKSTQMNFDSQYGHGDLIKNLNPDKRLPKLKFKIPSIRAKNTETDILLIQHLKVPTPSS